MFTLEQIAEAQSRVKSGADFPAYVQALIALGVERYTSWLTDGHIAYEGGGQLLTSPPKHAAHAVAPDRDDARFKERLLLHQRGGTDFPTFCNDARAAGVQRWVVDMRTMTCTYFSPQDEVMLVEAIPRP